MAGEVILIAYLCLGLAYWVCTAYGAVRMRGIPDLWRRQPRERPDWPRVSVVAAARNEADKIEAAMGTLLAEDYPDLEVVLVDDRSTDETGRIIDQMAARDRRVRALHVEELPAGWLGKVHALSAGARAATGQFLLFTDADVHFRPGILRRAVDFCMEGGIDHLAALPAAWPAGLLVDTMVAAFLRSFLTLMMRPWRVAGGRKGAYCGVGAFNLCRREALEKSEGLEWLRLETADDLGLALLMRRCGSRSAFASAFGGVGLHWYRSVAEAARGAEKGFASLGNCRFWRMALLALPGMFLELSAVAGLAALCAAPLRPAGWTGAAVLAVSLFSCVALARWARAPVLAAVLSPLAAPLTAAMTVRAAFLGWRRGGVAWRGTLYPSSMLRDGRRVRVP